MEPTKLLYLEDMSGLNGEAHVLEITEENGKQVVILNQTLFYPQGGGQPYDQGFISSSSGKFKVDEVRYLDGIVKHIGSFESGVFSKGETVSLNIDPERRKLNSRIHSAGHLLDMSIYDVKPNWIPGKGYHFPDGPYVEYKGEVSEDEKESLARGLEEDMQRKIAENVPVTILFVEKNELAKYCRHVPDNVPEGKPTRVVLFGDFGVPCGGTHVNNLSEIKSETIRKIKGGGSTIKVSYDIER